MAIQNTKYEITIRIMNYLTEESAKELRQEINQFVLKNLAKYHKPTNPDEYRLIKIWYQNREFEYVHTTRIPRKGQRIMLPVHQSLINEFEILHETAFELKQDIQRVENYLRCILNYCQTLADAKQLLPEKFHQFVELASPGKESGERNTLDNTMNAGFVFSDSSAPVTLSLPQIEAIKKEHQQGQQFLEEFILRNFMFH